MRAYTHLKLILIIILSSSPIALSASVNVWLGIYDSISSYLVSYYQGARLFIVLGVCGGIFLVAWAVRNVYKECREKVDAFSWPSEEAKRETRKDIENFVVYVGVIGIFFVGGVFVYYLFIRNLLHALTYILNVVSVFTAPLLIAVLIIEVPTLLIDIMFGNFLQSLFQKLSGSGK